MAVDVVNREAPPREMPWSRCGDAAMVVRMDDLDADVGGSVVGGLTPFTWDQERAVQHEVAMEVLSQLVAACTHRREEERAKQSPDEEVLQWCSDEQDRIITQQGLLRTDDEAGVAAVLQTARERRQGILDHG